MFSLGCIQALRCNTNQCPVGVATQDPHLVRGLVVEDKRTRVKNFQEETVDGFLELLGAAGLGIAYHAKDIVKERSNHAISTLGIDSILYLLGIKDREQLG